MPSYPSLSPRLLKGAIVSVDPLNPAASAVVFQYNPETVTRTLAPQMGGEGAEGVEALRLRGAPIETIKMDIEVDATDQLEVADADAVAMGIGPRLAAIEMLIYPKSTYVVATAALLSAGTIEIVPPESPLTVLVWGTNRVVPIKITELSITEEAFDARLNPTRAKVSLGMQVLSYNDLPVDHAGYNIFLAHQVMKEAMAVVGSARNVANMIG